MVIRFYVGLNWSILVVGCEHRIWNLSFDSENGHGGGGELEIQMEY